MFWFKRQVEEAARCIKQDAAWATGVLNIGGWYINVFSLFAMHYAYFSSAGVYGQWEAEKKVTEAGKGRGVPRTTLISLLAFMAFMDI